MISVASHDMKSFDFLYRAYHNKMKTACHWKVQKYVHVEVLSVKMERTIYFCGTLSNSSKLPDTY